MKQGHKFLLIQFRKNEALINQERRCFQDCLPPKTTLETVSVFDPDFPWFKPTKIFKKFTAIILGGSSEFGMGPETDRPQEKRLILKRTRKLIRAAIENDYPVLAVCFGLHLLTQLENRSVSRPLAKRETGAVRITLTKQGRKDKIFAGVPQAFMANSAHIESATRLPPESTLLAKSENCPINAYRLKTSVYALQFHPELTGKRFLERLVLARKKNLKVKIAKARTPKIVYNFLVNSIEKNG